MQEEHERTGGMHMTDVMQDRRDTEQEGDRTRRRQGLRQERVYTLYITGCRYAGQDKCRTRNVRTQDRKECRT